MKSGLVLAALLVTQQLCHGGESKPRMKKDEKVPDVLSRIRRGTNTVVFHVKYGGSQDLVNHPGHPLRVPYNRLYMNIGNGYNIGLHAFVAPRSGLYMFSVEGLSGLRPYGCIQLRKNNAFVGCGHAIAALSTMTITRPLYLKKGDSVFVTMCPYKYSTLDRWYGNAFTGILVQ